MWNVFGGGKSNSVRDNHIKLLERWSSATPTMKDRSKWSVKFQTRTATFIFYIILPPEFPDNAPVFKFEKPVDHRWVDSHDGVTILNESLLQWNPHCDITQIGKACVHEFVVNPPRLKSRRAASTTVAEAASAGPSGRVGFVYRTKPFGLKLRPKIKGKNIGASIHSFENFHQDNGLETGMWLVSIGLRDVEKLKFNDIIKLLSEVSVPVKLEFDGRKRPVFAKKNSAPQAAPAYVYGKPVYKQPGLPPISISAAAAIVGVVEEKQLPEPKVKDELTIPDIPDSTFNVLDKYNINQLKDLLADDLALEQLALDIANKDLNRMRKKVREETREVANNNLSSKEPIDASRKELEQLRQDVEELQSANRTLFAEQQRLSPKVDKFQVRKAFAEAAEKIDEESQELVDKFENDDIAYVTFIKKYKVLRESYHEYLITKGLIA